MLLICLSYSIFPITSKLHLNMAYPIPPESTGTGAKWSLPSIALPIPTVHNFTRLVCALKKWQLFLYSW